MSPGVSERILEVTIEETLLQGGPNAQAQRTAAVHESPPPYGEYNPGGYLKRLPEGYDRSLCLIPHDVLDFILATQPKEWKRLKEHHGAEVRERVLKRLASEIERRGALDVLRNGVKDSGCKFKLTYFRPASGLNEELQRLHAANLFAVVRQHLGPAACSGAIIERTIGSATRKAVKSDRLRLGCRGSGPRIVQNRFPNASAIPQPDSSLPLLAITPFARHFLPARRDLS